MLRFKFWKIIYDKKTINDEIIEDTDEYLKINITINQVKQKIIANSNDNAKIIPK